MGMVKADRSESLTKPTLVVAEYSLFLSCPMQDTFTVVHNGHKQLGPVGG